MNNHLDLTNKVALVTGASSGIGAATAAVLAELGADVAISYHLNQAGAEKIKDDIERSGRRVFIMRADVRESDQIRSLVSATVEALGPIDILVNNAGSLVERQSSLTMTEARWNEVICIRRLELCSR